MSKTADQLRAEAADNDQKAAESFERSDTDGFLSQWALGITAQLKRAEARLLDEGGVHDFVGLFTESGDRVKAKLVNGQYGMVWMLLDEEGEVAGFVGSTRAEVGSTPSARSRMGQMGLHEDWESAPAKATIHANGTGLSGAATARVVTYRTDGGFPEGSVVL